MDTDTGFDPDDKNESIHGLHMISPLGENQYFYTQFEVWAANKVFPCFDQPDLKAFFALDVLAPSDWIVVSSNFGKKSLVNNTNNARWRFEPLDRSISTYVFPIHGGNFDVIEDKEASVPTRFLVRKEVRDQIEGQVPDWFHLTRVGLEFFEDKTGQAYPFPKYDHVIVPEYTSGAMENVGAVTYHEKSIAGAGNELSYKSLLRTLSLWHVYDALIENWVVGVIFHEMAHMWFGNYATPNWWNNLWMNESFASLYPLYAINHISSDQRLHPPGKSFYKNPDAYLAYEYAQALEGDIIYDHEVAKKEIKDTKEADDIFNSVTYSKGGVVLKTLKNEMGEFVFDQAIRDYITVAKNRDIKASDFYNAVNKNDPGLHPQWLSSWFGERGVSYVTPQFSCEDGKITKFSIKQTVKHSGANNSSQMKPLLLNIKLFDKSEKSKNGQRQVTWRTINKGDLRVRLETSDSEEFSELKGFDCPDFVNLNHGWETHLVLKLDNKSLSNLESFSRSEHYPVFWHGMDKVESIVQEKLFQ